MFIPGVKRRFYPFWNVVLSGVLPLLKLLLEAKFFFPLWEILRGCVKFFLGRKEHLKGLPLAVSLLT
nr:MAG: hypothetical protein KVP17_002504 [Porospora cf. gigantea B]